MFRWSIFLFIFMILALSQFVPPAEAALPNGLQDIGGTFTTPVGPPTTGYGGEDYAQWDSSWSSLTYDGGMFGDVASAGINMLGAGLGCYIDPVPGYTTNTDTRTHWFRVTADNVNVHSFQLTDITLENFLPTDSYQVTVVGTLAGGGTITAGPFTFAPGDTANHSIWSNISGLFNGQHITSFQLEYVANAGSSVGDFTFIDFSVSNAQAPVTPPTVTTGSASSISTTGATLNGTVNANGDSTTVTFDYGLTTSYGSSVTASQSPVTGSTATAVSAPVSGLDCGTLYHFRAKGVNGGGTTNGSDATFTTSSCNTAPTIANLDGDTMSYTVGTGGRVIDQETLATVSDSDSADLNTGTLTISVSGATAADVLGVRNQGTGSGLIGVSGSNVTYGGTTIGSFSGGSGTSLVVTFNSNATPTVASALLANITYTNASAAIFTTRSVGFTVSDGDGGTSVASTVTINVTPATVGTIYTVTNLNDSGAGSLRQAVTDANGHAGADTIVFSSGLSGTINLASRIDITGSVTVQGPGADLVTINGGSATQFLKTENGDSATNITVTISGLTFDHGRMIDNDPDIGYAGAIDNREDLTLSDVVVKNTAVGTTYGDAGWAVSVIATDYSTQIPRLTILNSVITGNKGSAIGALVAALLDIENSTISNTSFIASNYGGGMTVAGVSATVIKGSYIASNSAQGGGAIYFSPNNYSSETLWIENSTITGNITDPTGASAGDVDGAVAYNAMYVTAGLITINNSTIAGNSGYNGAAKQLTNPSGTGTDIPMNIINSIIYYDGTDDVRFSPNQNITASYNVIENVATIDTAIGNVTANPNLAAAAANGGPTYTQAIGSGSDAVNLGTATGAPVTDQRGFIRNTTSGVDAGAYEYSATQFRFIGQSRPLDGAVNVPSDTTITLDFGGAIATGSGNMRIYNADTNALIESISVAAAVISGSRATFTPASNLPAGANIYVEVDAGAFTASVDGGSNNAASAAMRDSTGIRFVTSANTAPTFVGSTTTLTVNQNASATDIKSLLHASDTDSSQTLTWSQSVAPNHSGTLSFSSATASSGSTNITPGGTITYQPATGYSGTETFTVQVSDGTASATRQITVTVNPIYTVTYNGNGNTGGTAPSDGSSPYVSGTTVTVLGNTGSLTRTGYTFSGWNTSANGSGTSYSAGNTFTIDANTTLYARWTATVSYNGNGATGGTAPIDATSYLPGATVTVLGNTGSLSRTGYTFSGWNTDDDGSGTDYAPSATFTMSGSVTLYAKWTINSYTVTYDGNGSTSGTVPVDSASHDYNSTVTVLANTSNLSRTGYTFSGWNTAANGSGTDYAASGSATFTIGASNVTLYAKWTINSYTVTYDSNGASSGTVPVDSASHDYNSTVTVLANTGSLTRTAYTFSGWNTQADGGGTDYDASGSATFTMGTANVTLYAKWTANVPTVTGVSPTSGPSSGGTSVTITGTDLTGATAVKFGSTDATSFTVDTNTQITATSPAGSVGTVHVTVTTAGGTTTNGSADQFTYLPTVTGVAVGHGAISCASPVTSGSSSTCTITPDPGYRLTALTDNSSDILAEVTLDKVTIENVTASHTVTATFTAANYGSRAVTSGSSDTGLFATVSGGDGTQHLVYERDGSLYYRSSTLVSGSWSDEETVAAGHDPSIATKQDGTPVIAFISGGEIQTTSRSASWSIPAATGISGANTVELAVDGSDRLHLAYTAVGSDGYDDILYANNTGGSFGSATTICDGSYASSIWTFCRTPLIQVDTGGNYHIVYSKQQINTSLGAHDPQYMVYTDNSGTRTSHDLNSGTAVGTPQLLARGAFGHDTANGYTLTYGNDMEDSGIWLATGLESGWSESAAAVAGTLPAQGNDDTALTRHMVYITPDGRLDHISLTVGTYSAITELAPSGERPYVNPIKKSVIFRAADTNGVEQLYQVGIGALALLIPSDGNLGNVVVGNTTEKGYTLANNGSSSLTVNSIATGNPGYTFEIGTDNCTGHTLLPGQSCTFTVKNSYQQFAGVVTDSLTITSDDPVRGTITIPLSMTVVEPYYPLNITMAGSGTVTATAASQSDFTCTSGVCSRNYDTNTVVTLTAVAPTGYTFTGYTLTADGSLICREAIHSITITGDTGITANFSRNSYVVTTLPTANGSVSCTSPVLHGNSSACTLAPNTGYRIEGVGGSCGGNLTGTTYTTNPVTGSCTVEAVFAAETERTVSVTVTGTGAGSVYSYPASILCPGTCSGLFDDATAATLTAAPDSNSTFGGWSGACTNSSGPCELTLTENKSVTASFTAAPKVKVSDTGYQTIAEAYAHTTNGSVIKARSLTFTEALILNLSRTVTLEGGFNAPYDCNNCGDNTVVDGYLSIENGCLVIENLSIK